jgi:hypothetical protein
MPRARNLIVCAICLAFTLLSPAPVTARDIDRFLTGSWYNPAQSGHGFSLEVSANGLVVIYWYTYHHDGTPTFILAVGQANGDTVTADAYYNTGMRFGVFDPDERTESPWGSISITFHDCQSATVEYESTFEHGGMAFGSGSFPIQRLVSIDQLQCQNDRKPGIYEGTFYSAIDDATYYGFVLVGPGGQFAAYSDGGVAAFGEAEVNGLSLSVSGVAVSLDPDDPFSGPFSGEGDFSAEYRLFSFYEVSGGDEGFGDFYASPALYRRKLTPTDLAGNYNVRNPITGFTGNATIGNNGNINGSDELGCQYAGNLSIPDTRFNLFEVTITISNCPGYNATYEGLGSQIDWIFVDDRRGLRVLVTDGNFGFLLLANK